MDQNHLLTIFVALTAIAVVLQMVILFVFYLSVRKTGARMEALSRHVEEDVVPAVRQVSHLVTENSAKVSSVVENLVQTTGEVRAQVERFGVTLNDVLDRTQRQVVRADEMVSRTMDRVEQTAETVQHAVLTPARRISGFLTGVVAGFGEYAAGRKVKRAQSAVPQEEMFI